MNLQEAMKQLESCDTPDVIEYIKKTQTYRDRKKAKTVAK